MRDTLIPALAALLVGLVSAPAPAQDVTLCRDAGAVTGDTLSCGGRLIRLHRVSAPAEGEAGFEEARAALERRVRLRTAHCRLRSAAFREGPAAATCFVDGRDVGAAQVRAGFAQDVRSQRSGSGT